MPRHALGVAQTEVAGAGVDAKTVRLRGDQRGRASIGKQQVGDQAIHTVRLLKMETAKLEIHHQYHRVFIRAHYVPRRAKADESRVTAHESDECPLDARRKSGGADDIDIQPRRVEA